jgi:pyruvate dehydrogenase E1 component
MQNSQPIQSGDSNFDNDPVETQEWLESLAEVLNRAGPARVSQLISSLDKYAYNLGVRLPYTRITPYVNTIPIDQQPVYPGNRDIERRLKSYIRWNAMAMVVRANRHSDGIGGHISTYASAATLIEVGFNHFFRSPDGDFSGDQVFFQGHASPGIYARAFLENRLSEIHMNNFRRELHPEGGLSSYPHPWLMPNFWQFPTVSMGLGPITAIYQARFNEYLKDRGLKDTQNCKVWCFVGDGETDEPETLGAINLASREQLENLIFVINCNLQRLDGPVRGNSRVVDELEAAFRGAGWNVIKVLWGSEWDALLARDKTGMLVERLGELIDGEQQKLSVESGAYIRSEFFGKYPELLKMVEHLSDEELKKLRRGGHDPQKVYAAYKAAVENTGSPTVVLAHTVKGYGLGEAGEGRNITHQQKKMNEEELGVFRTRFGIPISDVDVADAPFYKPPEDSVDMKYLHEQRRKLGGYMPERRTTAPTLEAVDPKVFEEFHAGTKDREVSTTMAIVRILSRLIKEKPLGKHIVPIVPDEARTFGMEAMFRQCGIYSHVGQLYEPVDASSLLYYKEARDGQILEEGITEAGSMSSFIAAGTAYSTHGINMIPFFLFYSMFGMQRIGDLVWLAGDIRTKGFLIGATAGRTTLNGEGLQHEDGHSHLLAYPLPNLLAYDPAYAYEAAVIVEEGIRRMYVEQEDIFYYITAYNENYRQPPMPKGVKEGIIQGIYLLKRSDMQDTGLCANLMGSGPILNYVIEAARVLEENYGVAAHIYSVTSYKQLYMDQQETCRTNLLHPGQEPQLPCLRKVLKDTRGVYVAASDYVRALPDLISASIPGRFMTLGTDGFGRSDSREALRDFFEVDGRYIVLAALYGLALDEQIPMDTVSKAIKDLSINPDKLNPLKS